VITAVPDDAPVTIPLPEPTVATVLLPLVHVPPPRSLSVVVLPTHVVKVPEIGKGSG